MTTESCHACSRAEATCDYWCIDCVVGMVRDGRMTYDETFPFGGGWDVARERIEEMRRYQGDLQLDAMRERC